MSQPPIDISSLITPSDFSPETKAKLSDLLDAAINTSSPTETLVDTAASGIDQLCPLNEDAEGFLWPLWTLFINISQRIPLDDSRAETLVAIVQKLKAKQTGSVEIWGNPHNLWADLPLLGPVMREAWNYSPQKDTSPSEQATISQQWISLNSFAARLLASSTQPWTDFALWELRDGLEEPLSTQDAKETRLTTASEWIAQAGKVLYEEAQKKKQLDERETRALRSGSLWKSDEAGFSQERWVFWKKRLEELKADTSAEVQKRTDKTLEVMRSLEA